MNRILLSFLSLVLLSFSAFSADWMQWRGQNHDGVSTETGLLKEWGGNGPKLLWKAEELGVGYSNLTFADGKIFSMGDFGNQGVIYALDEKTGKEVWSLKVGRSGGTYEGPRCTPATDGKLVFAIGQFGDLVCADVKGEPLWSVNVEKEYGGRVMSGWNFSMSPVIEDDLVILPIGGNGGTVAAFEKSGKKATLVWRSKEITDAAAYNSVVPLTFGGVRQCLVFTDKQIAGLDVKTGKVLWKANKTGRVAVCSDPAYYIDGNDLYVIASSAYNVGATGFKITVNGKDFKAEQIYEESKLQNHHGGIVQVGGYFYFITQRELVCVNPKTGKIEWSNRSVGKGSIMSVDGKLIVRGEGGDGEVALVEASPTAYKEISRFPQPDRSSKNSWTYPTVYNGKLYIRDQGLLLCYEIK
jgi:outer membrane protein assembly factor BamB